MSYARKFIVNGIDDRGDVHSFSTDDGEKAEEARRRMSDDLDDVELSENFPRRGIG